MSKSSLTFSTGLIVGAFVSLLLWVTISSIIVINPLTEKINEHKILLEDCEQHLPRNVHCELRAVVAFPKIDEEK